MHWRRKWQPTPVFLPGESQGWRSLVGCCLWGLTESDTTEVTATAAAVRRRALAIYCYIAIAIGYLKFSNLKQLPFVTFHKFSEEA